MSNNDHIVIGDLELSTLPNGNIWLCRASGPAHGEGMEFDKKLLSGWLEMFYEKHF